MSLIDDRMRQGKEMEHRIMAESKKQQAGSARKMARKLERAKVAQQTAERKVGKLRARLQDAETRLTKRAHRVETLAARTQQGASEKRSRKPAAKPAIKTEQTIQEPAAPAAVESLVADDMHLAPLSAKASNGNHARSTSQKRHPRRQQK